MGNKKVVIIGGDAAGLKTAARLRRLDTEISIEVIEKGDVLSYAACGFPYFVSGDVDSFSELIETAWGDVKDAEFFEKVKHIHVNTNTEATAINRKDKIVSTIDKDDNNKEFPYDYLVIATGAAPVVIDVPGCDNENVQCFTRPDEAIKVRKKLQTGQIGRVAVVGAGYIGLELCEAFGALWGAEVVLIEKEDHVLPRMIDPEIARLVEDHLKENDVVIKTNCTLNSIHEEDNMLKVNLCNKESFNVDVVILAAGVKPRSDLARDCGIEVGPLGGILVNGKGQTSDASIFAAGDCAELPGLDTTYLLPLGSIANRLGRVVANNLAGKEDELPVLNGSAVVKIFDLNVGVCGKCAERLAYKAEEYEEYWGTFPVNAHYFPESQDVLIKVTRFKNGKLAGIQAIGEGEVVRWVNAFAQILDLGQGEVSALKRFEHAYAPPFATALDPLHHMAAMIEAGPEIVVTPSQFRSGGGYDWIVINLLDETEMNGTKLPEMQGKVFNILPRDLASRLDELKGKKVVTFCARGPRSFEAATFLNNHGINARYASGGTRLIKE